jgi:ADP-heptose:LPS heptosyltransferase
MLSRLRASRPGARISLLVRHYPGELLVGHPAVDELLWYDTPDGAPVPFGELLLRIRESRFDTAIVVHPTPRLAWLMFRSRIPVRVGTGYRYYSPLFNRKVYEHRRRGDRHELEYNLGLLGPLGITTDPPGLPVEFNLTVPGAVRAGVLAKLGDLGIRAGATFAVVHPGSGGSARDWPPERFASLAGGLVQKGVTVLVTGSTAEGPLVDRVVSACGGGVIRAAGVFSLQELAAVLEFCSLFVGNSSGPLHLAVAMGAPVVGLYPQIPGIGPRRWGPYAELARVIVPDKPTTCRECHGRRARSCACMESIGVEMVARTCLDLLQNVAPAGVGRRP